jgi:hypothetical protein
MNLTSKMSEAEIEEAMKDMAPVCHATKTGFFICVDGYEEDPRELWEIPEVATFFQRLVSSGFISFLEVSATAEGLTRLDKEITSIGFPGFGALEVWMISKGMMHAGRTDIDRAEMKKFISDLDAANAKSRVVVSKPKQEGVKKTYNLCDGQQKFTGSKKWNTK